MARCFTTLNNVVVLAIRDADPMFDKLLTEERIADEVRNLMKFGDSPRYEDLGNEGFSEMLAAAYMLCGFDSYAAYELAIN